MQGKTTGTKPLLATLLPEKKGNTTDQYYLQVREQKPSYLLVGGILMILLSVFCVVGGLTLGIQGVRNG